jgi:crotonobetainyl-CoA:carnitine CoA-transferase CaiB-like acyl-CoA transferase
MLETGLTLMASTITDYLATGNEPKPRGNAANCRSPGAGSFPCKEGMLSLGVNEESQFRRLAVAIGKSEWLNDPRFTDRAARTEHAEFLEQQLAVTLKSKTSEEWEQIMAMHSVPAAKLRTLPECLSHAQIRARGFVTQTEDNFSVPLLPFKIGTNQSSAKLSSPPEHGADSNQLIKEKMSR